MIKTLVLGIGNILQGDDGIGIYVIQALQKMSFPDEVELVDGGTAIIDVLGAFLEHQRVIVIDCMHGGSVPGTIYKLGPDQLGGYVRENTSLHDLQVLDLIQLSRLFGHNPEVILIGVEPKNIAPRLDLSCELNIRIPEIVLFVKDIITD
jgi:hydrogenase maturation protease